MMLWPYKSGSRGNLYEVYDGYSRILLECGLPLPRLRGLCKRPLTEYGACLVTHEHQDHGASAKQLARLGIQLHMSAGTAQALGMDSLPNVHRITDSRIFEAGGYRVKPFAVHHDAAEPLGYLIQSVETGEKLVFATDTSYMQYTFAGVREIAVECNYSLDSLRESGIRPDLRRRIERSHFEVGRVLAWLKACDLRETRRIWLLHLSGTHSNSQGFQELIQGETGIETKIAEG